MINTKIMFTSAVILCSVLISYTLPITANAKEAKGQFTPSKNYTGDLRCVSFYSVALKLGPDNGDYTSDRGQYITWLKADRVKLKKSEEQMNNDLSASMKKFITEVTALSDDGLGKRFAAEVYYCHSNMLLRQSEKF